MHQQEGQEDKEQRRQKEHKQTTGKFNSNNTCFNSKHSFTNYYFSNKSDIIDCNNYEYFALNKKLLLLDNNHTYYNDRTNYKSILTVIDDENIKEQRNELEKLLLSSHNTVHKDADNTNPKTDSNILANILNQKQQDKFNFNLINPLNLLLVLLILSQQQNALSCNRLGHSERYDNFGFHNYNNPYQSMMIPNNRHFNRIRSLDISEPLIIMPTTNNNNNDFGNSFANDQNINGPPISSSSPQLQGWTSMLSNVFQQQKDTLDKHIKNILVPRVSGTEGNVQVRNYIVNSLKSNDYHVQLDEFTDSTPIGDVKFANIIADSNPNACRQLVLACHYDSKMMEGFLGATDSAVPCAMLLKMSETFSKSFRSKDNNDNEDSLSLRFIFFDGEEAFEQWGPTDSLYGSRHLASKWEKTQAPDHCNVKNELKRIELFLILDLIGSSDTTFVMYNRQLARHYNDLMKYEKNYLSRSGLSSTRGMQAFKNRHQSIDFIEDDHVPFLRRGVPVLSLLAYPFPEVWHKVTDNYSAIDFPRTRRILHVLEEFVANYKKI